MLSLTTEEERIVGVLHDVVEDCPEWPLLRLEAEGFSKAVLDAVASVTKLPQEEQDYDAFILRAANSVIGRRVKIADLNDNLDLSRIANPTERDLTRLAKYRRALAVLTAAPGGHRLEAGDA
jgi:(p)ppGpp synthase/HD superfamily hydrolase